MLRQYLFESFFCRQYSLRISLWGICANLVDCDGWQYSGVVTPLVRLCPVKLFPPLFSLPRAFTSWKPGHQTELTELGDTAVILTFIFSPFTWPFEFISEVCCYDNSVWSVKWQYSVCVAGCAIVCECTQRQTGSQTAVPAESSYHHQGRLNRDEQINYRRCVSVANKV